MPEKKKKSGFYYFMLDFKKAEEKNGKTIDLNQIRDDRKCEQEWRVRTKDFVSQNFHLL